MDDSEDFYKGVSAALDVIESVLGSCPAGSEEASKVHEAYRLVKELL